MAADIGALTAWSTTAGSNQPDASDSIANLDDNLQQIQAQVRKYLATKGADIASASTVDLSTATGNYVHVTGTTTVTALGTVAAGFRFLLVFDGALTFTHNATSLILPGGANITTAAGDRCEVVSLGSGNWRCLWYQRASGEPVSGSYQPLDAELTAIAGLTSAANKIPYFTGSGTAGLLTTGTASGNVPLVGTSSATESLAGLVELATVSEVITGTDTARAVTPAGVMAAKRLTLGTDVTASGTAVLFTGIPSGTKRIILSFSGLSTNGTDNYLLQIGDSGGIETTGYLGASAVMQNLSTSVVGNFTTGMGIVSSDAGNVHHGSISLVLIDDTTNLWSMTLINGWSSGTLAGVGGSTKALSGELTQLQLTTTGGVNTFDAGTVNIAYS